MKTVAAFLVFLFVFHCKSTQPRTVPVPIKTNEKTVELKGKVSEDGKKITIKKSEFDKLMSIANEYIFTVAKKKTMDIEAKKIEDHKLEVNLVYLKDLKHADDFIFKTTITTSKAIKIVTVKDGAIEIEMKEKDPEPTFHFKSFMWGIGTGVAIGVTVVIIVVLKN